MSLTICTVEIRASWLDSLMVFYVKDF